MRRSRLVLLAMPVAAVVLISAGALLGRARTVAGELAAEARIRSIHAEQSEFHIQFGRYARSLQELGIAAATESYSFTLEPTHAGYVINASPVVYGSTGRRTFYSDQSMAIRQNWSSVRADINSAVVQ